MKIHNTRREFLADVGRGMLVAAVGYQAATDLGLAAAPVATGNDDLSFGSLEPLVCMMQETPVSQLLPALATKLKQGTDLRQLVAAGALANARTFGGEDYIGFHTIMALGPSYHIALETPEASRPLPVLKVLYRNTARIQARGGRKEEVLHTVQSGELSAGRPSGELLREAVRRKDVQSAEKVFAAIARQTPDEAFDQLLLAVHDNTEVHRVVLPYRAWDLVGIIGKDHAHTLLRQSVRYCVEAEAWPRRNRADDVRELLPKLMEEHQLLGKSRGTREVDDAWIEKMSQTIFSSTPAAAAAAAAAALQEGINPDAIGEAISLAANQLVLRDAGRPLQQEGPGKPVGSVHGDSIGVHASDSANAWRNMARISNARNCCASLILGSYQLALDRVDRGGDFLNWQPLPFPNHAEQLKMEEPEALLREADAAIRNNLQARVCAVIHRYGQLGHPHGPVFDLLRRYAVSEDGSLHAEKYFRTVREEFTTSRAAFRWRHLVGLGRVTASEFGRPAAGVAEARELLGLT